MISSYSSTDQARVLLQTPNLLNALLTITTARNWSQPTIAAMRLHAYLAQGILPGSPGARWAQLPGLKNDEIRALPPLYRDFKDVITALEEQKKNSLAADARKTLERWGRIEIVDVKFRGMFSVIALCVCLTRPRSHWRAYRDAPGAGTSSHEAPCFPTQRYPSIRNKRRRWCGKSPSG
jgi:hypothetical protein